MSDQIGPATPFFIVSDISKSREHYVERLGFEYRFRSPDQDPFFGIVGRGSAQIMLKATGERKDCTALAADYERLNEREPFRDWIVGQGV